MERRSINVENNIYPLSGEGSITIKTIVAEPYENQDVVPKLSRPSIRKNAMIFDDLPSDSRGVCSKKCERRSKIFKFLRSAAENSLIAGIPQIVAVKNNFRRAIKILVLLTCLGLFLTQTVIIMKIYYSYPTRIETKVVYTNDLPLPKLTLCNVNGFERIRFCTNFPQMCTTFPNATEFCSIYPKNCLLLADNESITVINSDMLSINTSLLEDYSQKLEDMLHSACFSSFPVRKDFLDHRKKSHLYYSGEFGQLRKCYEVDFSKLNISHIKNEFQTHNIDIDEIISCCIWTAKFKEVIMSVIINLDPKQYSRPELMPSVQVGITAPNVQLDPFFRGFRAKEGMRYIAKMQITKEKFLTKPYWTNCTPEKDLENDYDKEKCITDCVSEMTFQACNCTPFFEYKRKRKICSTIEEGRCFVLLNQTDCYGICPKPCTEIKFNYAVEERPFENTMKPFNPIELLSDLKGKPTIEKLLNTSRFLNATGKTIISILFEANEIVEYDHEPVYSISEIAGYIGGYSGMWLGLSFIAISEFLEYLLIFLYCILTGKELD